MKKQTLGTRIAELRKEHAMTQLNLAEKMGVTDKAVSKWERDLSCPDVSSLPRLAEILEVSIDELMQTKPKSSSDDKKEKIRGIMSLILKVIPLAMGVSLLVLSAMKKIEMCIRDRCAAEEKRGNDASSEATTSPAHRAVSVSYTHLDVYKRQEHSSRSARTDRNLKPSRRSPPRHRRQSGRSARQARRTQDNILPDRKPRKNREAGMYRLAFRQCEPLFRALCGR